MFVRLVIVLTATHLLAANPLSAKILKVGNGRIYGGAEIPIAKAPWQVSVHGEELCGGVIYSPKIVLTAAHCFPGYIRINLIFVRYGSNLQKSGGSVVGISAISVHENYSGRTLNYDVAVLLLSSPIKFSAYVKAIPLATSVPETGAKVFVSGWGSTETTYAPTYLLSVQVTIVDKTSCSKAYSDVEITKEMVCAAAPGKDSCQGDSGGPLVYQNQLVGIVSHGKKCAHPHYPGVYANVPELRDWIVRTANNMNSSSSSENPDIDYILD